MEIGSKEWEHALQRVIQESRQVFLKDCRERLEEIDHRLQGGALQEGDRQVLYGHFHAIRGVALTLGYRNTHDCCGRMLRLLKKSSPDPKGLWEIVSDMKLSLC